MGRYANRTVQFDFPDLSEDDDLIYVVIRNPKTVPADKLMPSKEVPLGADGKPEDDAAMASTYEVMSGLIVGWHVYDGLTDDDDTPPLELPATPEKLRSIPFEIVQKIAESIGQVLAVPR